MKDTMCVEMKDGRRGWVNEHLSRAASQNQGRPVTVVGFGGKAEAIDFRDVVTTFSGVSTPMTICDATPV